MRAVICTKYGSPDVLEVQTVEKPVPKENELLIKICETVVSATDCTFRLGKPFIGRLFTGLRKPKYIPGDLLSGVVETVGKNVKTFSIGDQLFGFTGTTFGAHAEYICLPESFLTIKPTNIGFGESAAVCDGGLTALPFLRDKGKIKSGQTVLINGAAGAVGSAAVQIAKYYGADVTAVCSSANFELVKSLGADKAVDYTKEDFAQRQERYNIIFDAVGKSSFSVCKKALKKNGIYLTTVPTWGTVLQMIRTKIFGRKKACFSATGLRKPVEKVKDLLFLKELIEAGKYRSHVDRRYPLVEIGEAHRYVEQGHKKGNVVITVGRK